MGKTEVNIEKCKYLIAFCTVPPNESDGLARSLVERKLAACVNVIKATSHYRYEGALHREEEDLLIIKTTAEMSERLKQGILELHSYEVPEIVMLPIVSGHAPYLEWIDESLI